MIKKIILILAVFMLIAVPAGAEQAAQIEINASQSTVEAGSSFTLSITTKNASTGGININSANIPGIENFRQAGSSQSTQIQMINGATTAVTQKSLSLIALTPGNYELGPIKIEQNGRIIAQSGIISIKVVKQTKKIFFTGSNKSAGAPSAKDEASAKSGLISGQIFVNIIFFLALILMIYYLYKWHGEKSGQAKKNNDDEVPGACLKMTLPKAGDKRFYKKAKEELLAYLQKKYKLDSESLTSREVLAKIKQKAPGNINLIKKALTLCDHGRFAANNLGQTELLEILSKFK